MYLMNDPTPKSEVSKMTFRYHIAGACPGGGKGLPPPPPPEIEKQKKKVIRANFKLFHLYFATFLVENVIFSAIF